MMPKDNENKTPSSDNTPTPKNAPKQDNTPVTPSDDTTSPSDEEDEDLEAMFGGLSKEERDSRSKEDLEKEVTNLHTSLAALSQRVTAAEDRATEAEKSKERIMREFDQNKEMVLEKFAKDLLPVMDTLERALQAMPDEHKKGIELTQKELMKTFNKYGISKIEAKNQPFDPDLHQAVTTVDCDDVEPDTVTEELQSGYKLKDRVLRPAMVKVSR